MHKNTKVLIGLSERHPDSRKMMSHLLRRSECESIIESSATLLMKSLIDQSVVPDAIVLDTYDNLDATIEYAQSQSPSVPLIAMTTNTQARAQIALRKKGFSEVLLKPINIGKFMDQINAQIIGNDRGQKLVEVA